MAIFNSYVKLPEGNFTPIYGNQELIQVPAEGLSRLGGQGHLPRRLQRLRGFLMELEGTTAKNQP